MINRPNFEKTPSLNGQSYKAGTFTEWSPFQDILNPKGCQNWVIGEFKGQGGAGELQTGGFVLVVDFSQGRSVTNWATMSS